jgi:hypothetical protein
VAYSFRAGARVTFTRDDGQPGPGQTFEYPAGEGWKVQIQDEGCVEISGYGKKPSPPPTIVVGWHRIWQIEAMSFQ